MEDSVSKVIELLDGMSREELEQVYGYMHRYSLWQSRAPLESHTKDLEWYVEVMNDILGIDIKERGRKNNYVWGRFIVMYQLLRDGWPTTVVGDVFGMNHSSVIHGRRQVQTMLELPASYFSEMCVYKEFKRRIKDGKMRMAG